MDCAGFRASARHKITIQQNSGASDSYGGQSTTWADVTTVWAAITPLSGREIYAQGQNQSRVTAKMTIRYLESLKNTQDTAKYRVSYDSRVYSIQYLRNLADDFKSEGKSFQELYVTEGGPENGG